MSREAWIAVIVAGAIVLVGAVIGTVILLVRVFRVRNQLGELGFGGKFAFYGAVIFTFFPVDLLPDPIYLDDMGVLGLALLYLNSLLRRHQERLPSTLPPQPRGARRPARQPRR
ncbi:hypothetical protein Ais01nite_57270 [Asanoa ishikariensis]|uniref:DUF1232 domain-containing protein n=1 Tax=Asanoa ishikariensis TaxID=137265 RepID=A0A1H3TYJ8_9ACTN|nr:hypothetical protein [Asanoa ishikariensis]GIF67692.1 hypothetical protein Ais01nite_57270 [Asanoa ishikariensis]SDZ55158.1 hypothetical protein SAMN05421684_6589 [Asanoa ishikariensis]